MKAVKLIKTVKGYQYCVTANEEVSITDDYGMDLTCPAGQQTYFIANANEAYVMGDATITQTRWGFIAGGGKGGGGGETIQPGEVIIGGTQGSYSWVNLNEVSQLPFALPPHLPEGVTLERLTTVAAQPSFSCDYVEAFRGFEECELPASVNLKSLFEAGEAFKENGYIKRINASDGLFGDVSYVNAFSMFLGCYNLESFEGNLQHLQYAENMFYGCNRLKYFRTTATITGLLNAREMFSYCKLDLLSLQNIASKFGRPADSYNVYITIGYDGNTVTDAQAQSVQAILVGKGWRVTMQRNY